MWCSLLPTAREGSVFTGVCLSTIGLMDIGSLLGLVMVRSVHILLECFFVQHCWNSKVTDFDTYITPYIHVQCNSVSHADTNPSQYRSQYRFSIHSGALSSCGSNQRIFDVSKASLLYRSSLFQLIRNSYTGRGFANFVPEMLKRLVLNPQITLKFGLHTTDRELHVRARSHRAKAETKVKKIKEKMTNIKENFCFYFHFRSMWMSLKKEDKPRHENPWEEITTYYTVNSNLTYLYLQELQEVAVRSEMCRLSLCPTCWENRTTTTTAVSDETLFRSVRVPC